MISAGIDIGTNTFRLLIAEYDHSGLHPLARGLVSVRLGRGLAATGAISPAAIDRAIGGLTGFRKQLDRFRPESVRACGTAALRRAVNSSDFLEPAHRVLGLPVEIISGSEEARLSLAGVRSALKKSSTGSLLVVDVGGGSSELIGVNGGREIHCFSLELGAVSLSEKFPDPADAEAAQVMDRTIDTLLETVLHQLPGRPELIGSGGTITSLAALDLEMETYRPERIQGHIIDQERLAALFDRLASMEVEDRNRLPQLGPGRGDIILAGTRIFQRLLDRLGVGAIMVSDAGLLEGILLSGVARRKG